MERRIIECEHQLPSVRQFDQVFLGQLHELDLLFHNLSPSTIDPRVRRGSSESILDVGKYLFSLCIEA